MLILGFFYSNGANYYIVYIMYSVSKLIRLTATLTMKISQTTAHHLLLSLLLSCFICAIYIFNLLPMCQSQPKFLLLFY